LIVFENIIATEEKESHLRKSSILDAVDVMDLTIKSLLLCIILLI